MQQWLLQLKGLLWFFWSWIDKNGFLRWRPGGGGLAGGKSESRHLESARTHLVSVPTSARPTSPCLSVWSAQEEAGLLQGRFSLGAPAAPFWAFHSGYPAYLRFWPVDSGVTRRDLDTYMWIVLPTFDLREQRRAHTEVMLAWSGQ